MKWQDISVDIKTLAPAPGLYTYIKSRKNCIQSDVKEIFLKLATNDWSGISVDIKISSPRGCQPLPWAIYEGCSKIT